MPSGFNVTAETLQADATRIATGAGNIEGHLAFLKNAVESVVNSGWVGVAANEAANLHAKLDKAGRDVKESTSFFSQSTDQAAKNYSQREDEVRSAFSGGGN
jgi:WXG100 family type VII secretion target